MKRASRLLLSVCFGLSACAAPGGGNLLQATRDRPTARSTTSDSVRYQADDMERRLRLSGIINSDESLNAYIKGIGCRVAGDACSQLRFYVVETPEFNASMAPNGMMLINSGLLLRVESEAELAFVLAHEFNHYARDHIVELMSRARGAAAGGSLLTLGLMFTGIGALAALGYLPGAMSVTAFGRDQERESDIFALQFANENQYDAAAGIRAWENLRDEMGASSNDETRRRFTRGSIFATHPLTAERIEYLSAASRLHPGAGEDKAAYRAVIRPHLHAWLAGEIAARDPGASLQLLGRLAASGADMGVIEFSRGEVYRYRDGEGDAALALASFRASAQQADAPAETWRQLGVMHRKLNDMPAAAEAFRHYLDVAPNAPDRELISMMISSLEGTQQ